MRIAILILLYSLIVVACSFSSTSTGGVDNSNEETITEYIKIDDDFINTRDTYAIIDPVWWTANIYDGEQKYFESLAPFSDGQRHLFAVIWYIVEVNNGGHDQFYFNSTGIVWKDALAGFKELGIDEGRKIIEESASRMGGNPSLDRSERQKQLDIYKPDFGDLDTQFYSLEDTVNIDELMRQYILQHRSQFYFEGEVRKYK